MIFACSKSSANFMFNNYSNSLSIELTWFIPGVGECFHFTWGLERKQGPRIWDIITFFFYSKANAPYFPGVGVSIDRCINLVTQKHKSLASCMEICKDLQRSGENLTKASTHCVTNEESFRFQSMLGTKSLSVFVCSFRVICSLEHWALVLCVPLPA